jgi:hypothetical protein
VRCEVLTVATMKITSMRHLVDWWKFISFGRSCCLHFTKNEGNGSHQSNGNFLPDCMLSQPCKWYLKTPYVFHVRTVLITVIVTLSQVH